ncbi:MAG: hypothetical protein MHM6MM_002086 [Cercozoa sp. M6MM]
MQVSVREIGGRLSPVWSKYFENASFFLDSSNEAGSEAALDTFKGVVHDLEATTLAKLVLLVSKWNEKQENAQSSVGEQPQKRREFLVSEVMKEIQRIWSQATPHEFPSLRTVFTSAWDDSYEELLRVLAAAATSRPPSRTPTTATEQ